MTLVVLSIFFEITLVGGVPLLTELVPGARSVVMAVALAAGALGRAIGSLAGPLIWEYAGFRGSSVAATAVMFLGILVLARWVKEFSPASLPAD